jgi:hypothetical protein
MVIRLGFFMPNFFVWKKAFCFTHTLLALNLKCTTPFLENIQQAGLT